MSSPLQIARRARTSMLSLGARQVLVQGLNILTSILLARWLVPADYAVYVLSTFLLGFFVIFGDLGLSARLVQQEQNPTPVQYASVFSAQQLLIGGVVLVMFLLSPVLAKAYGLGPAGVDLFRMYAVAGLVLSFQVISMVKLERHLDFQRIALVEVAASVAYNGSLLALFLWQQDIRWFGVAMLLRNGVSCTLAQGLSPWRPQFHWDRAYLKDAIRFGLPYQGTHIASLIKDSFSPVVIGILLGKTQYGLIGWAQTVAAYSVWVVMILQRIYLPLFSRLRTFPAELQRLVNDVLVFTNLLVAPIAVFTLVCSGPIVHLVFGDQWLVALPMFYWLWLANLLVPSVTPLLGLANAFGKSKVGFVFALVWLLGNWLLAWSLVSVFGLMGYGYANALVQLTNLVLFWYVKRWVRIQVWSTIVQVWLLALVPGAVLWWLSPHLNTLWMLVGAGVVLLMVCWGAGALLFRQHLKWLTGQKQWEER